MLSRLSRMAEQRSVAVLVTALLVAVVCAGFGASVAERLDPLGFDDPDSQSARASAQLDDRGYGTTDLVVLVDGTGASPQDVEAQLREDPSVATATSLPRSQGSAYVTASFAGGTDKQKQRAAERIEERLADQPGVAVGGPAAAFSQLNHTIESDLIRAEMLSFPILLLLALLLFRSLVAAALPLVVGAVAVVGTLAALRLLGAAVGISVLALNVVTALGFGLAIDYSLFMVARYREELARQGPGREALRATMQTAGRTVFFSSITVAAAMSSLLVFPQQFLYSIGIGGVVVSLLAALVALAVLPAMLHLLGARVDSLAPRFLQRRALLEAQPVTAGRWYRTARLVMRRPGLVAVVSSALLLTMALPALDLRFTAVDGSVLPTTTGARQVHEALAEEGLLEATTPLLVLVEGVDAARVLATQAEALPGATVAGPPEPLPDGGAVLRIVADSPVFSTSSQDLVAAVRELPGEPLVTGATAEFVDLKSSMADHLPLVTLIIVLSTIVAIFLMTGSIVLGLKALVMGVLTLAAVFGVLVAVFQHGRLESVLGYTSQGALESTMPLILFAGVFGLSTDYGVFLLARIKEARDSGVSDAEAVAIGQAQTGRLITSAALLFCVAVGAFATSRIVGIKEMTLGIALGVLLDATIVRIFLVPSLMQLLSGANWWSPAPLTRLYERIGLTESDATPSPAAEGVLTNR